MDDNNLVCDSSGSEPPDNQITTNIVESSSDQVAQLIPVDIGDISTNMDPFTNEKVESSNQAEDTPSIESTSTEEKPTEPFKKVKLKRSHILKKLTTPSIFPSTSSPSTPSTSKSTESLKLDDVTSSTIDTEATDGSSNSDTSSPTPRKKVKLIRPRVMASVPMRPPFIPKKEVPDTTISEVVATASYMDATSDVADVIAQIDQIIGVDDGNIDSMALLDTDDLNLQEEVSSSKALSFEDLSNDLSLKETDSSDSLMKIVGDLAETVPEDAAISLDSDALNMFDAAAEETSSDPTSFPSFDTEVQANEMLPEIENSEVLSDIQSSEILPSEILIPELQNSSLIPEIESSEVLTEIESSDILPEIESSDILPEIESSVILPEIESSVIFPEIVSSEILPEIESSDVLLDIQSTVLPPEIQSSEIFSDTQCSEVLSDIQSSEVISDMDIIPEIHSSVELLDSQEIVPEIQSSETSSEIENSLGLSEIQTTVVLSEEQNSEITSEIESSVVIPKILCSEEPTDIELLSEQSTEETQVMLTTEVSAEIESTEVNAVVGSSETSPPIEETIVLSEIQDNEILSEIQGSEVISDLSNIELVPEIESNEELPEISSEEVESSDTLPETTNIEEVSEIESSELLPEVDSNTMIGEIHDSEIVSDIKDTIVELVPEVGDSEVHPEIVSKMDSSELTSEAVPHEMDVVPKLTIKLVKKSEENQELQVVSSPQSETKLTIKGLRTHKEAIEETILKLQIKKDDPESSVKVTEVLSVDVTENPEPKGATSIPKLIIKDVKSSSPVISIQEPSSSTDSEAIPKLIIKKSEKKNSPIPKLIIKEVKSNSPVIATEEIETTIPAETTTPEISTNDLLMQVPDEKLEESQIVPKLKIKLQKSPEAESIPKLKIKSHSPVIQKESVEETPVLSTEPIPKLKIKCNTTSPIIKKDSPDKPPEVLCIESIEEKQEPILKLKIKCGTSPPIVISPKETVETQNQENLPIQEPIPKLSIKALKSKITDSEPIEIEPSLVPEKTEETTGSKIDPELKETVLKPIPKLSLKVLRAKTAIIEEPENLESQVENLEIPEFTTGSSVGNEEIPNKDLVPQVQNHPDEDQPIHKIEIENQTEVTETELTSGVTTDKQDTEISQTESVETKSDAIQVISEIQEETPSTSNETIPTSINKKESIEVLSKLEEVHQPEVESVSSEITAVIISEGNETETIVETSTEQVEPFEIIESTITASDPLEIEQPETETTPSNVEETPISKVSIKTRRSRVEEKVTVETSESVQITKAVASIATTEPTTVPKVSIKALRSRLEDKLSTESQKLLPSSSSSPVTKPTVLEDNVVTISAEKKSKIIQKKEILVEVTSSSEKVIDLTEGLTEAQPSAEPKQVTEKIIEVEPIPKISLKALRNKQIDVPEEKIVETQEVVPKLSLRALRTRKAQISPPGTAKQQVETTSPELTKEVPKFTEVVIIEDESKPDPIPKLSLRALRNKPVDIQEQVLQVDVEESTKEVASTHSPKIRSQKPPEQSTPTKSLRSQRKVAIGTPKPILTSKIIQLDSPESTELKPKSLAEDLVQTVNQGQKAVSDILEQCKTETVPKLIIKTHIQEEAKPVRRTPQQKRPIILEMGDKTHSEILEASNQIPKISIKNVRSLADEVINISDSSDEELPEVSITSLQKPMLKPGSPTKTLRSQRGRFNAGKTRLEQEETPKTSIPDLIAMENVGKVERAKTMIATRKSQRVNPAKDDGDVVPKLTIKTSKSPKGQKVDSVTEPVEEEKKLDTSLEIIPDEISSEPVATTSKEPEPQPKEIPATEEKPLTRAQRKLAKQDPETDASPPKKPKTIELSSPLEKITLKLSKEGGHPEILHSPNQIKTDTKREPEVKEPEPKKMKIDTPEYALDSSDVSINIVTDLAKPQDKAVSDDVTIVRCNEQSKLKEILLKFNTPDLEESSSSGGVMTPSVDPLAPSNDESSSQSVVIVEEIVPEAVESPRRRGRPRKSPIQAREEPVSAETPEFEESDFSVTPSTPRGIGARGRRGPRGRRGGRGSRGGRGAYKRKAEALRLSEVDLTPTKMSKDSVFMEEETRMSAEGGDLGESQIMKTDDESRSSSTTIETNRNKRGRLEIAEVDTGSSRVYKHVTGPDQIAEYSWNNGGPYMLQEQVAEYLGVKSFKRKYPGLDRHPVDMQERDYIRENGLASESLCDMGLTAVLSSEILDIMYTDFQDKYEEYRKYQREKQAKDVTNKQRAMASSMATIFDKNSKEESVLSLAVRSAATWNANLNKTRQEERRCYLDLQTYTIMYPKGRKPVTPYTNPGNYPVALVPGQFSEHYRKYSSQDLKYLPLNTVLYGPMIPNQISTPEIGQSDGSCSESESSSGSDSDSSDESDSSLDGMATPHRIPLITESDTCKMCVTNSPRSKPSKKSFLIYCAQCNSGIHPPCIDLTPDMMPYIQGYPWQCTDCKTCSHCRAPSDDDKMIFCDRCDRGYHIYCVGLRKVPNGRWHCQQCTSTTSVSTLAVSSVSVSTSTH